MKQQPLYKQYRDWDAGIPEDRTSQEEAAVKKKLGGGAKGDPILDENLENAVLFLLFVYKFTAPALDFSPPDPNKHTPVEMRDKRLLQKAKAAFEVLGPHMDKAKAPLMSKVRKELRGCDERILSLHEEVEKEKNWRGTFIQQYVPQDPPLIDAITGKQLAADSGYVLLEPSGRAVTREDHVYLNALHVVYHFWDYVMWAFQEADNDSNAQEKSIYSLWNRLWGASAGGDTWKYMGATPFRQRIIQLRAMFLAAVVKQ